MTIQLSTALRNAMVGQYEPTIGTAPRLQIRTGAQPANCAAADSGTLLAEITLPSDWMGAASAGAVAMAGGWAGTGAEGGTAAHYRLKDSAGATCHEQGSITATGGGGDLTVDNVVIAPAQAVTVTSWIRTQNGA